MITNISKTNKFIILLF